MRDVIPCVPEPDLNEAKVIMKILESFIQIATMDNNYAYLSQLRASVSTANLETNIAKNPRDKEHHMELRFVFLILV